MASVSTAMGSSTGRPEGARPTYKSWKGRDDESVADIRYMSWTADDIDAAHMMSKARRGRRSDLATACDDVWPPLDHRRDFEESGRSRYSLEVTPK
jgi:hypothetical protein